KHPTLQRLAFLEEICLFTDIIPSATILWYAPPRATREVMSAVANAEFVCVHLGWFAISNTSSPVVEGLLRVGCLREKDSRTPVASRSTQQICEDRKQRSL